MDPELYDAARSGDVDFLQRRREDAADVLIPQKTPNGSSVLHIAAEFNRENFFKEVVALCPKKKSLLEYANIVGETALHVAAREGSTQVVDFIIAHTKRLFWDIEEGQPIEGYKELLRMVNRDGENALHIAAQYGHFDVASSLVQADPQLAKYVNQAGQSPCFMATVRKKIEIIDLLLGLSPPCSIRGGANEMTALHAAAVFSSYDIMRKIVNTRPEMIRESDAIGWTPLHYAAFDERVDAVEILLERDPSAAYLVGKEGESALHIAAFNGHISVMKVLIDIRPDCWDILNNKRRTALHAAVLGGKLNVVEYILGSSGCAALGSLADEDGNTPLHLAAICKNKDMMISIFSNISNIRYEKSQGLLNATNKQNLTALDICEDEVEGFRAQFEKVGLLRRHERGMSQINKPIRYERHQVRQLTTLNSKEDSAVENPGPFGNIINEELVQVTSILIATVTFTAGFTMPGGYNQSGGPDEGMAVLASKTAFQAFLIFDLLAFFTAISSVFFGFSSRRHAPLIDIPLNSEALFMTAFTFMAMAFSCGIYVVLVESAGLAITVVIFSTFMAVTFYCCFGVLMD